VKINSYVLHVLFHVLIQLHALIFHLILIIVWKKIQRSKILTKHFELFLFY